MTSPVSKFRASADTPTRAQRAYTLLLVSTALLCAWLTLSALILEVLTRSGGPS